MNITEFRTKYPQYNDINDIELSSRLYRKHYPDMSIENFGRKFVPHKSPSFFQQLKEEFQRGRQQDIEKLQQIKKSGGEFAAGLKEKWPQMVGGTVGLAAALATAGPDPTDIVVAPTVAKAVTQALTRLGTSYIGGATGKTGQEVYRVAVGSEKAAKNIWEAIDRIQMAGEEELLAQATGEILATGAGRMLRPFAGKLEPGTPALSRKLGRALHRLPEEELAKTTPQIRKMLRAKTWLPRLYRDATGKIRFGRVPRIRELLTPAQKTISPGLDWVENATESSIFGGGRIKLQKRYLQPMALRQLMRESTDEFWRHASKRMSDVEIAELFTDAITGSKKAWRSQQKIAYKQIDRLMRQTAPLQRDAKGRFIPYKTISLERANRLADQFLKESTSGAGSAPARRRLANLVKRWHRENPGGIGFERGIEYRSDILEAVRKYESVTGLKSAKLNRVGSTLAKSLDSAMAQTAKNNSDEMYAAWRNANKLTKAGYAQFQTPNLTNALRFAQKNPGRVSGVFFQPYAEEGLIELKKLVPKSTFRSMRASWVEKAIRKATDAEGNVKWRAFLDNFSEVSLGKKMVKEAFPEKELYRNFMDGAKIATLLQEKGGAGGGMVMQLTQAGQIVMSGVSAATGQPVQAGRLAVLILAPLQVSRILTRRGGSRLLAEGLKMPARSPQAAGLVARILKLTQGEEPIAPVTKYIKHKWKESRQELLQTPMGQYGL